MNQEIIYSPIHARDYKNPETLKVWLAQLADMTGSEWYATWEESGRLSLKPLISPKCTGLIGSVVPQEARKVT